MSKALVVGGAGYIGSALVPKLLEAGHRVTVLDLYLYGEDLFAEYLGNGNLTEVNGDLDAAPPVVFLHGGPGGAHNSLASMLGLADERAVILYDQLDSGKSDRPNDPANWRVERFVEGLETIRRTLIDLTDRCHGDDRPECPILDGFAAGQDTEGP